MKPYQLFVLFFLVNVSASKTQVCLVIFSIGSKLLLCWYRSHVLLFAQQNIYSLSVI